MTGEAARVGGQPPAHDAPAHDAPAHGGRTTSRRRFVKTSLLALAGAALASTGMAVRANWEGVRNYWGWYRHALLPAEERLRRHFGYLSLDPAGVSAYVRAYEQSFGAVTRSTSYTPDFFTRYLLSSDLFLHGDESRTIRYVAFFDPYQNPCWNPCLPTSA